MGWGYSLFESDKDIYRFYRFERVSPTPDQEDHKPTIFLEKANLYKQPLVKSPLFSYRQRPDSCAKYQYEIKEIAINRFAVWGTCTLRYELLHVVAT